MKMLLGLAVVVVALAGCGKCGSGDGCCSKDAAAKAACGKDCTKPCCAPAKK